MTPPPNPGQRPNPDLSDEVEAFLKSVQQKQGQQRRTQPRQPARRPSKPVMAEVVPAPVLAPVVPTLVSEGGGFGRGASISGDAVAKEAEGVGQQAQALGSEIDLTDERVAEQLHNKFDHQLGQFGSSQSASDDTTEATSQRDGGSMDLATDLRRMLSDPYEVRRAIVLSEILNPPVDRW